MDVMSIPNGEPPGGLLFSLEHETGFAGQQSWPSACQAELGREPAFPSLLAPRSQLPLTLAKRKKGEECRVVTIEVQHSTASSGIERHLGRPQRPYATPS
jgi:hypothetical protein